MLAPRSEWTLIGDRRHGCTCRDVPESAHRFCRRMRPISVGGHAEIESTSRLERARRRDRRARGRVPANGTEQQRCRVHLAAGHRGDGNRRHHRAEPAKRPHDRSPPAATHRATRLSRHDGRVWLRTVARSGMFVLVVVGVFGSVETLLQAEAVQLLAMCCCWPCSCSSCCFKRPLARRQASRAAQTPTIARQSTHARPLARRRQHQLRNLGKHCRLGKSFGRPPADVSAP